MFVFSPAISRVSWCFKPSQPQRIISGLRETFIKRYIVERTSKAEIRPEEQIGKAESFRENLWKEIQLKGPQRQEQTQGQDRTISRAAKGAHVDNATFFVT